MPKELERKLRKRARKMFPSDKKQQDRYVYGSMRNSGAYPEQARKAR